MRRSFDDEAGDITSVGQPQRRRGIFYGWWVVGACLLTGLFAGGVVFFGFTAIFEPIVDEFGWSYSQVSLAASLRGVELGLLGPLLGVMVDRWGPRRLLFGGALITGLGLMVLSRTNSLAMFYAAFVLIAMGMSASSATVILAAVVHWFRRRLSTAVGITTSGFALGGLMVPVVSQLIDDLGWRSAMVVLALGMWVLVVPLSLVVRHKPEQYGYLPDGDLAVSEHEAALRPVLPSETSIGAGQAVRSRTFWHISLSLFVQFMAVGGVVIHVMPYLSDLGISRAESSLVASVIPIASVTGRLSFGWLADRFEKHRLSAWGFVAMVLGLLAFGVVGADRMWLLAPSVILFGLGWGGLVTMRTTLLSGHFGRASFGTIHGILVGVVSVGQVVGAFLPGWVYDQWGSYQGIWAVLAVLSLAAAIAVLTTPPVSPKTPALS